MKESDFQKKLLKSLREQDFWAEKFPDMPRSEGLRFTPEKPADIIAVHYPSQKAVLIECKMMKGLKALNRNVFRSSKDKKNELPFEEWNQVKSLNNFAGNSYVALNVVNKKDEKLYNYMVVFRWPWLYLRLYTDVSIKKDELDSFIKIEQRKGYDCESFKYML